MEMKSKVLVMDDEPLARLMVCSALESCGVLVSEAGSCAEALVLARNTEFDAAVFDYRLPDGDGLDLLRILRKEGVGFPVIMLSGESSDIEAEALEVDGICAILSKPANMDAVIDALECATGHVSSAVPIQVGRYAFWQVDNVLGEGLEQWDSCEWLAIDFSKLDDTALSPALVDCIQRPRKGVAILGAGEGVRKSLSLLGIGIEFVSSREELAALSRHPSSPAERSALLGVTVQR